MTRGSQNLTTTQKALLDAGRASYAAYQKAQDDIERRVQAFRDEISAEVEAARVRWTQDAYATKEAGVPVTRLARDAMGHTGTTAAYAAINEGARYAAPIAEQTADEGPFERVDDSIIRFTPDAADLAPVLARLDMDAETAPTSAEFLVADGVVVPTGAGAHRAGIHPVVAMVMADGSKYARALVEFAAQQ